MTGDHHENGVAPTEKVSAGEWLNPDLPTRQSHIVVVNDTQEILDLFKEILEEEGFRVSLYSSTFSDIPELMELQPDLVILDFIIGGEAHGWELLQKMKMTRGTMNVPVIVCTAALQLVREIDGHLRAKNVGVVLKPFDIDDLLTAVRTAISNISDSSGADIPLHTGDPV